MKSSSLNINLLIAFIGGFLFLPFLGNVHLFDWDEINFAECAREMIVTGDYSHVTINYQAFWEKPPLFIWLQVLSMKLFGINEYAARFPNAICGIVTLLILFNIGKKLYNKEFGLIWVMAYACSFLPFFYFKSGIIDPWFNLFIFCGIYFFILFCRDKKNINVMLSGFFIGLGILTKGPVALLVICLCVFIFWAFERFRIFFKFSNILLFFLSLTITGGSWFIFEIATGNGQVVNDFINYQIRLLSTEDAGHGGPFIYHFVVLLIGCFPASIFAIGGMGKSDRESAFQKLFKRWMMIMFWVVLILFSLVKTKIVHYSSLCYFPLTFLAAYNIQMIRNDKAIFKKWQKYLILIIGFILATALAALPFIDKYKSQIINSGVIKDVFATENLKANVHWIGYESVIGILLLVLTIIGIFVFKKENNRKGIILIFISSCIVVSLSATIIAPKVEGYSQRAALEFYESKVNEDCYIETLGFKSYAHLFYSKKKSQTNKNSYSIEWLLTQRTDKPTYFVCKITKSEEIKTQHPQLKELYRKNGFVFFKKEND